MPELDLATAVPEPPKRRSLAKRIAGISLGVTIALGIVGSAHRYLWLRLVHDPVWPRALESAGSWAIGLAMVLLFAYPIIERMQPPRISRFVVWPAFVWLGACFYLLLGFGAADTLRALVGARGLAAARIEAEAVLAGTVALLLVGAWNAQRGPVLREVQLQLPRWPRGLDGYRIVQLTDIHIGATLHKEFAQRIVDMTAAAKPDLIAVTGDLVDGSVEHLADDVAPFSKLAARDGVFFVPGNHDHYSGARRWLSHVETLGMKVLHNSHVVIEHQGQSFVLAGVDDPTGRRSGGRGDDVDAALRGTPSGLACILLAHDPRSFTRALARQVTLQISGHTHGGQIWPFGYLVLLSTRFVAGHYRVGQSQIYVSRGAGFWGPPVRLFAPSELTVLVISSA